MAGLYTSLKSTVATLVATVRTRLELFVTEVEEEKLRLLSLLLNSLAALLCLGLGVLVLVALLTVLFWENRVLVLGLFTALLLGAGFLFAAAAGRAAKRPSPLFSASLAELQADLDALDARADATSHAAAHPRGADSA